MMACCWKRGERMTSKERIKKLISQGTYTKVNDLLFKLNNTESKKDEAMLKEKLRDYMGKLFPYRDIFEFHDDHIRELAEVVADLYPEREHLEEYGANILVYINRKLSRYQQRKTQYQIDLHRKEKERYTDPDGYLDLKYLAWTYTEGYHHQQALMYHLLSRTLQVLIENNRKGSGKGCQRARKKKS